MTRAHLRQQSLAKVAPRGQLAWIGDGALPQARQSSSMRSKQVLLTVARVAALLAVTAACDDGHNLGTTVSSAGRAGNGSTLGGASSSGGASSRGGASSGGSIANGGSSVWGGAAGSIGLFDEVCDTPAVQFEFTVDDPAKYCVSSFGNPVEIRRASGEPVTSPGSGAFCSSTRCGTCNDGVCLTIGEVQVQLTSSTISTAWNGSYDITGTCGISNKSCLARRCIQSGSFVARYCLGPKGSLSSCEEFDQGNFVPRTACVDVPFTFPSSSVVRGHIATGVGGSGGTGAGGASSSGGRAGSGATATGGVMSNSGGVGATGGAISRGGNASAGTAGNAGSSGSCIAGCTRQGTTSFCAATGQVTWLCDTAEGSTAMVAAGCTDAATGLPRFCCLPSFQTQCN